MEKQYVKVVYDRKKRVERTGVGMVELFIYLSFYEKTYIKVCECNSIKWKTYQFSQELKKEMIPYEAVCQSMAKNGEEMTIANFKAHLGISDNRVETNHKMKLLHSQTGFVEFIEEEMKKESICPATLKRRDVVINAMKRSNMLLKFSDLTPTKLRAFDEFLRTEEGTSRTTVSINNYHKTLKRYTKLAVQLEYIIKDPYESAICQFKRGKCKERKPLSEEELVKLRSLENLTAYEQHACDLFIFSAYTGLAYADAQAFNFHTMTEKIENTYYIDGERIKTGSNFFTPILPPAMEILKKYDFKLPRLTNQKMNLYLHLLEPRIGTNKKMTSHVARHSFATLLLTYDVPIDKLAKMLGHQDIKTTQIYGHILRKSILEQGSKLSSAIL